MNDGKSDLPPDRLWQPTTVRWFTIVFGACLFYAVVRYHLAGDVAWRHLPLFILNKATSMAAVVFVGCSYLIGKVIHWHDHNKILRLVVIKFCGLMGFFLAGIHAFMAVMLMTPVYFAKYFEASGKMNLQGELGMSVGVVALFLLVSPAITTLPMMPKELGRWRWKRSQRLGYLSLVFVVVHLVVLGLKGWLTPKGWPAGLPPISLISLLAALVPLVVKSNLIYAKRQRKEKVQ